MENVFSTDRDHKEKPENTKILKTWPISFDDICTSAFLAWTKYYMDTLRDSLVAVWEAELTMKAVIEKKES